MSTLAGLILLAGRILFAGMFAYAARGHIVNHARFVEGSGRKLPIPYLAGWPTGVLFLVADVSIVAGIWPDIGALLLAVFLVPAGLTGLWQVAARAHASFGEALEMDVAYARNWSLGLDLWLLVRTPFEVLRRAATS